MDIDLARTFLEIVRHGSLAAAAEKLHVTQTAITARVQKLESQLGSTLFVRNRAGARLTPNGEAFVVYANQLVETWEAARRDLPLPEGYRDVLHIGGEVSAGPAHCVRRSPATPCAWKFVTVKTCCANWN
jgi:DNA-binding transcriptional LysR family regulator